jgi:hypothetical protein
MGHDDGTRGDIVWHDANSRLFLISCSISSWPAPMRRPRSRKDGLLDELKKALAERALNVEIDHQLEAGEADGR